MDRRERSGDLLAGLLALQQTWAGELYVACPGLVQSFDAAKRTCVIQPAIKAQIMGEGGETKWVPLPLLLDCPVVFPGGGDCVLTFPLKQGDEVLVLFGDRCIDAWWQSGGIQAQAELRMHDLSDGYCIPGPSSIPKVEATISTTEATLRSRDGVTKVRLNPATHTVVVETSNAALTVKPGEITAVGGNATVTAKQDTCSLETVGGAGSASFALGAGRVDVTGAFWINGKLYTGHTHGGVQPGAGTSGGVNNA